MSDRISSPWIYDVYWGEISQLISYYVSECQQELMSYPKERSSTLKRHWQKCLGAVASYSKREIPFVVLCLHTTAKHFYGMGGPIYNPYMVMEGYSTLADAT